MSLGWILSIVALLAGGTIFGFARWKAAQPSEPLKVRLFNYNKIAFLGIVIALLAIAHMLTLATGKRFSGRSSSGVQEIHAPYFG